MGRPSAVEYRSWQGGGGRRRVASAISTRHRQFSGPMKPQATQSERNETRLYPRARQRMAGWQANIQGNKGLLWQHSAEVAARSGKGGGTWPWLALPD